MIELHDWFEKQGWVKCKHNDGNDYWIKRYPDAQQCCDNKDKPGVQIRLNRHDFGLGSATYSVELYGGKADCLPVKLMVYNIDEKDIKEQLEGQAADLVLAWDVLAKIAQKMAKTRIK